MTFLALALGVMLLPIQTLIDALPKGPAGLNFQNIVTLVCLVGWYAHCQRNRMPMLQPMGDNKLNKRMLQYMVLAFAGLWYGKLFHMQLVDWPISLHDDRVVKYKDEMTGFLLFFVIAATIRDEKQMKRLVLLMFATIPYIIGVYYVARNADSLPSQMSLNCPEPSKNPYKDQCDIAEDDAEGNVTGKPGATWADVDLKEGSPLVVDENHPLEVFDWQENRYPAFFVNAEGRIRIDNYNRFSRTTLFVKYHQGIDHTKFSWAQKEVRGVFVQVGTNEMGSWYVHAMLFAVGILMTYRPLPWFIYLGVCIAMLGYGVIYSLSRAAWLAVCAAIGYLGARKSKALLVGFLAFILVAPAFLGGAVSERGGQGKDESAAHRLDFWKWAAHAGLVRYPVIGLGYGCYIPKHSDETGIKLDTHNFFFRTLSELGPVGLFLVFAILLSGFKLGWSVFEDAESKFQKGVGLGTALMVIGCIVGNMFGDRFSYISLNCWIFAMFGMSARCRVMIDEARARKAEAKQREALARRRARRPDLDDEELPEGEDDFPGATLRAQPAGARRPPPAGPQSPFRRSR